ncbi:MAG TPA: DUF4870 domain-containing protein [Streptosporangiaceae bacterium]|nr:DUF4870 domain-containing protein [Streptosporangiaceae bacterium]
MTSNPSQAGQEWPSRQPASAEPLDALPPADEGYRPADQGRHTAPQDRAAADPPGWPADPGHWPASRAPWPGPAAGGPQGQERSRVATREREHPAGHGDLPAPEDPAASAAPDDERLAMLAYLGVPFLGPVLPLVLFLSRRRSSDFVRYHTAQALSLSVTALLYTLCVFILGAMLALDSLNLALAVGVTLAAVLWLATLAYVIRAGARAYRGLYYRIPAWLCATIAR